MMMSILMLSVAGAIVAAVVGTAWYSMKTPMGRLHMRYLGFDTLSPAEQQQKMATAAPKMPRLYAAQLALSLLTSFFVVFVITMSVQNGLPVFMALTFPVMGWLCFVVPTVGSAILWGNCESKIAWAKFLSDCGSSLVTILAIAGLTCLFL